MQESAKTPIYAVRHASRGKGGKNWITADKRGNRGQMPAYIQNVRNAIMRDGRDIGTATAIAISRIRKWARGGGGVSPEVKAAAQKALAEFAAMRGRAAAKRARRDVREADVDADLLEFAVGCALESLDTQPWRAR